MVRSICSIDVGEEGKDNLVVDRIIAVDTTPSAGDRA